MFASLKLENKGANAPLEMEALYKHRTTLTQIFNTIDKDHSGFISREEFIEACKVRDTYSIILFLLYVSCQKPSYISNVLIVINNDLLFGRFAAR